MIEEGERTRAYPPNLAQVQSPGSAHSQFADQGGLRQLSGRQANGRLLICMMSGTDLPAALLLDPDEQRPNPMASLKPPKISDKLVPVFTGDELAALLGTSKGGGFQNRRDYAIISVFKDTGARPSELAGLTTDDVSPRDREAVVTGKGDKQRTIRFTYDTARALDRYQRERAKHKMARVGALWLGVRGGPMTASGVYQMMERRGRDAGVEVNPHKFSDSQATDASCSSRPACPQRDQPVTFLAAAHR